MGISNTLKQILIGGAIVAVCLTSGYIHVKHYRVVEVSKESLKQAVNNTEYVMKCYALGKVSKTDYNYYLENLYRFRVLGELNGEKKFYGVNKEAVYTLQQDINKYIVEESSSIIPDSYYTNVCKIKISGAMNSLDGILNKNDTVYRYFGKY